MIKRTYIQRAGALYINSSTYVLVICGLLICSSSCYYKKWPSTWVGDLLLLQRSNGARHAYGGSNCVETEDLPSNGRLYAMVPLFSRKSASI